MGTIRRKHEPPNRPIEPQPGDYRALFEGSRETLAQIHAIADEAYQPETTRTDAIQAIAEILELLEGAGLTNAETEADVIDAPGEIN